MITTRNLVGGGGGSDFLICFQYKKRTRLGAFFSDNTEKKMHMTILWGCRRNTGNLFVLFCFRWAWFPCVWWTADHRYSIVTYQDLTYTTSQRQGQQTVDCCQRQWHPSFPGYVGSTQHGHGRRCHLICCRRWGSWRLVIADFAKLDINNAVTRERFNGSAFLEDKTK